MVKEVSQLLRSMSTMAMWIMLGMIGLYVSAHLFQLRSVLLETFVFEHGFYIIVACGFWYYFTSKVNEHLQLEDPAKLSFTGTLLAIASVFLFCLSAALVLNMPPIVTAGRGFALSIMVAVACLLFAIGGAFWLKAQERKLELQRL